VRLQALQSVTNLENLRPVELRQPLPYWPLGQRRSAALTQSEHQRLDRACRRAVGRMIDFVPRALDRHVVVHETAQSLKARIREFAALLLVSLAAELDEGRA
jgi:hypothetical protein